MAAGTKLDLGSSDNMYAQYSLEPYKPGASADLIRVGRVFDGGYVINETALRQAKYLLSFGVSDDWSFEADFLQRNPGVNIFCFDNSVSKNVFREKIVDSLNQILSVRFILGLLSLNFRGARNKISNLKRRRRVYSDFCQFFNRANVQFIAKGVSSEANGSFLTMSDVFHLIPPGNLTESSVFIKMDIEQSEFRVLPDLFKFRNYVAGLVLEFHDLDILWPSFAELMRRLNEDFEVTHVHGNNFGGLIPDTATPKLLEITLIKRALLNCHSASAAAIYPIPGLDYPNNPHQKDYPLHF